MTVEFQSGLVERGFVPSAGPQWDAVYEDRAPSRRSWFQVEPTVSLGLLAELRVALSSAVVDIGAGDSSLVDGLLAPGYSDITVLDVATAALETSRRRLGENPRVTWLHDDVLTWKPQRSYDVWHDRAMFHFLVADTDRERYRQTLLRALEPAGAVVLATLATDGPGTCSGLPVARHDASDLARFLGNQFEPIADLRESHRTPSGGVQPFTWIAARRLG